MDDPHSPKGWDQAPAFFVKVTESLIPFDQPGGFLGRVFRLIGQKEPEVLDRRTKGAIVKIDDIDPFSGAGDEIPLMAVTMEQDLFFPVKQRVAFTDQL